MRPPVGGMKPVTIRMVVDLPAPFGPRKPSTSPRSTLKEMSSTARLAPKVLTRFSILIIASLPRGSCGFAGAISRGAGLSPNYEARILKNPWRPRYELRSRRIGGSLGGCGVRRERAAVPDETAPYYRALRPRRRLGFHRALHGAEAD